MTPLLLLGEIAFKTRTCTLQARTIHLHSSSDCRPDLVVFDSASRADVKLDIAIAHCWTSDTFPKSAEIDGAATKRREERKHSRYKLERLPGGTSVSLIPLVLEHYGRWGEEAWKFLQKLAESWVA